MRISLHHLAITETTPAEFAEIAAALRCDHICLFVKIPPEQESAFPYVFPRVQSVRAAHDLKTRLDGFGLSVWNVDTFMVQPGVEIANYHETLEIAAVFNRNFPGEGEFPLVGFVQHLPPDVVLSIEAPVNRLRPSLTPMERATRAVEGTRRVLAAAGC
jgi:hypothetical protein